MIINTNILKKADLYVSQINKYKTCINTDVGDEFNSLLDSIEGVITCLSIEYDAAIDIYDETIDEYGICDDIMELYIKLSYAIKNEKYEEANFIKNEMKSII